MSKSKSKSKSKSLNFPDSYWDPGFDIYTYYPKFFEHYGELKNIKLREPAREGDALRAEIQELLRKQNDREERERRRSVILREADNFTEKYANALLVGPASKTSPLMEAMIDIGLIAVMHFKKQFSRARPNQVEPAIEPLIPVPGHPSYPSGHSTQNFLIAHALAEVIGDDAKLIARVFEIARGVAVNREWAGVHYGSDTDAGELLARRLFPIVREVFGSLIDDAIDEWQEFSDDTEPKPEVAGSAASPAYKAVDVKGEVSEPELDLPWHLKNTGQNGGKAGVDIGMTEEAWKVTKKGDENVRVVLLDMAVHLDHESLIGHIDFENALNLDYPDVPEKPRELNTTSVMRLLQRESRVKAEGNAEQLADDEAKIRRYLDGFASKSSAHGTACAGVIIGSHDIKGSVCKGIAPGCKLVPYRAMTLTEPTLKNRQFLARKILEIPSKDLGEVLLCPLPLDPLPPGETTGQRIEQNGKNVTTSDANGSAAQITLDPLAFALAFVATKIPVIIPSGNDGTSKLSELSEQMESLGSFEKLESLERLAGLLGMDKPALVELLGVDNKTDLEGLIESMRRSGSGIITVGACNNKGYRSKYSQFGESLLIVAPSDDVSPPEVPPDADAETKKKIRLRSERLGTLSIATTDGPGRSGYVRGDGEYTPSTNEYGFGGTSAASAQVAGIVALMLSANRQLRPSDVRQLLKETATVDLLDPEAGLKQGTYHEEFGYGLVNAGKAVSEAKAMKR